MRATFPATILGTLRSVNALRKPFDPEYFLRVLSELAPRASA
jgi:hypothetical protein